jgi:hypothetical protein
LLKTIKIKCDPIQDFMIDDCNLIQNILIDKGYYATLEQCQLMWQMHSDCYAANWLSLYEDKDSIYDAIRVYFQEDQMLQEG